MDSRVEIEGIIVPGQLRQKLVQLHLKKGVMEYLRNLSHMDDYR
jgi:hypothetical protein